MKPRTAIALLLALLVACAVVAIALGLGDRAHADFWPLDNSRVGPNLVAAVVQWAAVAIIMAIVYPPFRKFLEREWNHLHAKLNHNAEVLHHIVSHHPDIPDVGDDGVPLIDKRPAVGRPGGTT